MSISRHDTKTTQKVTNYLRILTQHISAMVFSVVLIGIIFQLFAMITVISGVTIATTPVYAQTEFQGAEGNCSVKRSITMADILAPAQFFPVIPAECSQTSDGKAVPLSLAVLPDVAIRFFGALVSLIFYMFFFIAVFSGIQWIYGGIEERQALQAKRNFQDSFIGLIITLATYLIINTIIFSVLRVQFQYTNMNDFFSL